MFGGDDVRRPHADTDATDAIPNRGVGRRRTDTDATGAIRAATLLHGMKRTGGKYGMVTMCIGTGMGAAGLFEAIA